MIRRLLAVAGTAAIVLTSAATSGIASAATTTSNALRISPVRNDLTIKPGESKSEAVTVQNITGNTVNLRAIVNDFGPSSDESGQPKIYLDENSSAPSHGLKNYISGLTNVSLKPNESKEVKYTITMPKDAVGGYFGVVRFVPADKDTEKQISLTASVGSLVLITVPGDVKEQLGVASFNLSKSNGKATNFVTDGKGLQANVRFQNTGNIQLAPFGKVQLRKSGKTIQTYEINTADPKGVVLPDSIRKFSVNLQDKATSFGKYTVDGNFGYGSKGQLITVSKTFWVVPMPYIIALIILILIILGAIFVFPRMMKQHDRKLLKRVRSKGKK
jgi:hypothetical protein